MAKNLFFALFFIDMFSLLRKKPVTHPANSSKNATVVPVFKEGLLQATTPEEYKKNLGIEYYHQLFFASKSILKKALLIAKKLHRRGDITTNQKWLGTFFCHEIDTHEFPDISIHWIHPTVGYGVFANSTLPKKTFIGEYTGLLRPFCYRSDQKNCYTFEYVKAHFYQSYTIDAKTQGNHTRFINHKKDGNCDALIVYHRDLVRVVVLTNREIAAGEQLTYDYGSDYWAQRGDLQEL